MLGTHFLADCTSKTVVAKTFPKHCLHILLHINHIPDGIQSKVANLLTGVCYRFVAKDTFITSYYSLFFSLLSIFLVIAVVVFSRDCKTSNAYVLKLYKIVNIKE